MTQWRIRLSAEAETDIDEILNYTSEAFGKDQADRYRSLLLEALTDLTRGPDIPNSRNRDEIRPGLRSLHIARRSRKGRHLVLFRASNGQTIDVLRVLHDAMELKRHLPDAD